MPGIITHCLCAETALKKANNELRDMVSKRRELYYIGAQGPDIFFYYLPGFLSKNLSRLGGAMHKGNFQSFLRCMAEKSKSAGGEDSDALAVYLCGYLSHYALDTRTHPYIYYKSGSKGGKLRIGANHRNFETAIDTLMLKLMKNQTPQDIKLWRIIRADRRVLQLVCGAFARCTGNAYGIFINKKNVEQAMAYMTNLTRLLQSHNGAAKKPAAFAENLLFGAELISSLIHPKEISDSIDYLNLEKNIWNSPWNSSRIFNDSFPEMFEEAAQYAAEMSKTLIRFIGGEAEIDELLDLAGNKSFTTGLDYRFDV